MSKLTDFYIHNASLQEEGKTKNRRDEEPQGRIFAPRPAKQRNNLSASLPWNGRWGFVNPTGFYFAPRRKVVAFFLACVSFWC